MGLFGIKIFWVFDENWLWLLVGGDCGGGGWWRKVVVGGGIYEK